eukprot:TRINITY_DN10283_c0_g1_i1.p1 TRINITY_DN10283_c0_g1~~TRINITY_DN10283_c0_g1_i1.p1  ORF type:complete len:608 (-),score=141.71 TRINITY_DN10283_c0_g1_i1:58-1746(-)
MDIQFESLSLIGRIRNATDQARTQGSPGFDYDNDPVFEVEIEEVEPRNVTAQRDTEITEYRLDSHGNGVDDREDAVETDTGSEFLSSSPKSLPRSISALSLSSADSEVSPLHDTAVVARFSVKESNLGISQARIVRLSRDYKALQREHTELQAQLRSYEAELEHLRDEVQVTRNDAALSLQAHQAAERELRDLKQLLPLPTTLLSRASQQQLIVDSSSPRDTMNRLDAQPRIIELESQLHSAREQLRQAKETEQSLRKQISDVPTSQLPIDDAITYRRLYEAEVERSQQLQQEKELSERTLLQQIMQLRERVSSPMRPTVISHTDKPVDFREHSADSVPTATPTSPQQSPALSADSPNRYLRSVVETKSRDELLQFAADLAVPVTPPSGANTSWHSMHRELLAARHEYASVLRLLADREGTINQLKENIMELHGVVRSKESQLDQLSQEHVKLGKRFDEKETQLDASFVDLRSSMQRLVQTMNELDVAQNELRLKQADLGTKEQQLQTLMGQVRVWQQQMQSLSAEVRQFRQTRQRDQETILQLREQLSMFEASDLSDDDDT